MQIGEQTEIKLPNGATAYAWAFFSGEGSFVIPAESLDGLDGDQLIATLRANIDELKRLTIKQNARWLVQVCKNFREYWRRSYSIYERADGEFWALVRKYQDEDANIKQMAEWNALYLRWAEWKRRHDAEREDKRAEIARKYKTVYSALVARDGEHCHNCGSTDELQIDHIQPLILAGSNDMKNLQFLCRTCNLRKGSGVKQELDFFLEEIGAKEGEQR